MPSIEKTVSGVARFNFRLPSEIKDRVEQAALASGVTVTDFAIDALAVSADEVLERQRSRTLSDIDRDRFLALLEMDSEPNAQLKQAFADHKDRVSKR